MSRPLLHLLFNIQCPFLDSNLFISLILYGIFSWSRPSNHRRYLCAFFFCFLSLFFVIIVVSVVGERATRNVDYSRDNCYICWWTSQNFHIYCMILLSFFLRFQIVQNKMKMSVRKSTTTTKFVKENGRRSKQWWFW